MKYFFLTGLILLATVCRAHSSSENLYFEKVDIKVENGKDLVMKFIEIDRQLNYSVIKVEFQSGASVPSIMFMVKGCYEIAKIRGVKYFVNLKEWTGKNDEWMYKIGYTNYDNIDPYTYFGDDIDKSKDLGLMSVDRYKYIFEPE